MILMIFSQLWWKQWSGIFQWIRWWDQYW